jgi:hypothetical protein
MYKKRIFFKNVDWMKLYRLENVYTCSEMLVWMKSVTAILATKRIVINNHTSHVQLKYFKIHLHSKFYKFVCYLFTYIERTTPPQSQVNIEKQNMASEIEKAAPFNVVNWTKFFRF